MANSLNPINFCPFQIIFYFFSFIERISDAHFHFNILFFCHSSVISVGGFIFTWRKKETTFWSILRGNGNAFKYFKWESSSSKSVKNGLYSIIFLVIFPNFLHNFLAHFNGLKFTTHKFTLMN
jgi:hypothetical protein